MREIELDEEYRELVISTLAIYTILDAMTKGIDDEHIAQTLKLIDEQLQDDPDSVEYYARKFSLLSQLR